MQPPGLRIDPLVNGICAQDMSGKGIELRRAVSEEVGEGDGREGVRVGMVRRVGENHAGAWGGAMALAASDVRIE